MRERKQFPRAKCSPHRYGTIMQRDAVPPEQPPRRGQEARGNRAALQIDREYGPPRHGREARQQSHGILVFEMMQKQRRENEIEAAIREREPERVRREFRCWSERQVRKSPVQRNHVPPRKRLVNLPSHVPRRSADVQQRKRILRLYELPDQ